MKKEKTENTTSQPAEEQLKPTVTTWSQFRLYCPRCGSKNIQYSRAGYLCRRCGQRFRGDWSDGIVSPA